MVANRLRLNDDKTEIKLFGTKHSLRSFTGLSAVNVGEATVSVSDGPVRNLGVLFD